MRTLFDVQEWLKKYGYVNLVPNRRDAIYFMREEVNSLHQQGILADNDRDFLSARVILKREERVENEK
jgi:uncharacterized protein YqgQ